MNNICVLVALSHTLQNIWHNIIKVYCYNNGIKGNLVVTNRYIVYFILFKSCISLYIVLYVKLSNF